VSRATTTQLLSSAGTLDDTSWNNNAQSRTASLNAPTLP
jgi:hypothetical protein